MIAGVDLNWSLVEQSESKTASFPHDLLCSIKLIGLIIIWPSNFNLLQFLARTFYVVAIKSHNLTSFAK